MLAESPSITYDLLIDQQFLIIIDPSSFSVNYMNFPARDYCGTSEILKPAISDIVHPLDLEIFQANLSSLTGKIEKNCNVRLRGKDERWTSFNFRNRYYNDGNKTYILSLAVRSGEPITGVENPEFVNILRNGYEQLLDSLDEAFALIEIIFSSEGDVRDYLFLKTNMAYERQVNLRNVVGKTVRELLPNPSENMLQNFGQVALSGSPIRFKDKSNSLGNKWFDLYAFKVGSKENRQVALLFRNITDEKVFEEKLQEELTENQKDLKESNELLQSVFDTTNLGIAVLQTQYDEKGRIKDFKFLRVNKVLYEMYLQKDVVGLSYLEQTKYGKELGIFDAYKNVITTGKPFDKEIFFDKEDYNHWLRVTARKNNDLLITTIEDITKVKAEAEELRESLKFKKELVRTTPEVIMIVNLNTFSVRYINKDLLPKAGITREKVQNAGLTDIVPFIHPRDREKMKELHHKLLKSSSDQIYDIELRLKLEGINWEWFNVRGKVFRRRDENWVDEYVLLVRNISEQKNTQKALLKAEKFSIQGELARTFAHELRNPMASIGMVGEVLNSKISPDQRTELQPYFDILKRSTKTLNNLVSHLLNASNYTPSILEKQDLSEILENTLINASDRIYLAGIKLVKNYKGSFPIMADSEKLQIALLNIIVNASEATQPGEGVIILDIKEENNEFILSIKDNGHGMEEQDIEHLFEAFFSKKEQGMGVGLSSVKNILDEHDAQIKVESTPYKGTCFKLHFHNRLKL